MKKALFILLFISIVILLNAQKETNLLNKQEVSLLTLLLSDTAHNTSINLTNRFNFGLDNQLFTNSNLIKRGKDVYIQPLGTGRLYKAYNNKGEIGIERIDQTIHSGVNFYAQNFFINDTLYQFGGLGFWQIRGILCYFSKQTKQWELVQTNRSVQSYFDEQQDAIMHYDDSRKDPKLFISNSYYYPNYPSSFETAATDSCYVYDFHSRNWENLGKISSDFKKIIQNKHTRELELHIKNLLIFQSQLEFYWVDFQKNKIGQFNAKENNKLRQVWLGLYNNDKTRLQSGFQFNLGTDLYFVKLDLGKDLEWAKTSFDLNALDTLHTFPIYTNDRNFLEATGLVYTLHQTSIYWILFAIITSIFIFNFVFKKKRIPKEVVAILYQNFFASISIVEKELIEALLQNNLKGEELSTKNINKIIGVQHKDTLTQNKSRSDHFIKINQKFRMATQHTEPLIIKNRDASDKRQYNYDLNKIFVLEIEKLFKE